MNPLRALLAGSSFFLGLALRADQPVNQTPKVLPKVEVKAEVPLVKVADYAMLEPRFAPAAVVDGDYIYIIGGRNKAGTLDSVERFDMRTGKSEAFAKLKTSRFSHSAVLYQGKIYVLGGANDEEAGNPIQPQGDPFPASHIASHADLLGGVRIQPFHADDHFEATVGYSMEIIDLATRQVTEGVPMPDSRQQFGCVVADGRLYVIGGQRFNGSRLTTTRTTEIFDFATRHWSNGVPMPTPRMSSATLVDGGFIMVPGGYNYTLGGERDAVEFFNPKNGTWRILPPLAHAVSENSLVFLDHYLFMFGGDYLHPGELMAYDLRTNQSESFTLQFKPARDTAAVVHDGKVYVIGGRARDFDEAENYIQVFALRKKE